MPRHSVSRGSWGGSGHGERSGREHTHKAGHHTHRPDPDETDHRHHHRHRQRGGFVAESVPGDGSCLFHSVGRHVGATASQLRAAVTTVLRRAPHARINGVPLSDWVRWYADAPIERYAAHIAREGVWGGALELTLLARMYGRPIHVYEPAHREGCRRISEVEAGPHAPRNAVPIHLLYMGRSHYMPLFAE